MHEKPRVIIIGAGFGGMFAAKALAGKAVGVLLIDRNNFHTFTPLLYQVATSALDPSEIAYPVRRIFQRAENVRVLLGELTAIDHLGRTITLRNENQEYSEAYDYLILAAGSTPAYFGHERFKQHALDLRTLGDAVELRNHILRAFERAVWETHESRRRQLTTIVVVGGGPTGIETAGAIHELYNHVLDKEFPQRNLLARVVLVEMAPELLGNFPEKLRKAALEQLQDVGVEVRLGIPVVDVGPELVKLSDGTDIEAGTLVWAAGAQASPVGELLGVELASLGRVPVEGTMQVKGRERIYALGDMVYLEGPDGAPYPMLSPVAIQQGELAVANILADIAGRRQNEFVYNDRGIMATIGRSKAVAWLYNRIPLRGYIAWVVWLVFHLISLIGFRNRLNVIVNWMWNYFTYDRSVRIILEQAQSKELRRK